MALSYCLRRRIGLTTLRNDAIVFAAMQDSVAICADESGLLNSLPRPCGRSQWSFVMTFDGFVAPIPVNTGKVGVANLTL